MVHRFIRFPPVSIQSFLCRVMSEKTEYLMKFTFVCQFGGIFGKWTKGLSVLKKLWRYVDGEKNEIIQFIQLSFWVNNVNCHRKEFLKPWCFERLPFVRAYVFFLMVTFSFSANFIWKKRKTREENVSTCSCRDTWSGAVDVTKIEINCVCVCAYSNR